MSWGSCLAVGVLVGLLAPGVARAGCPSPTRSGDLLRPLSDGQAAFAAMDGVAFERAGEEAAAALDCLGEPISATVAAALHRHRAFQAWLADDVTSTRASFRAALTLQPDWRLPEDVAPANNPLAQLYAEVATLGPGPAEPVRVAPGLQLLVDGALAEEIPTDRPVIVQILSAEGAVLDTALLRPGEALPAQLSLGGAESPLPPLPAPPPPSSDIPTAAVGAAAEERGPGRALAISAGASLLASGGLYAWSAITHARYVTPAAAPDSGLDALVRANHLQVYGAAGLGAVALGLGVGAALSW